MLASSLFRGLLLGLVIAATPGPIFFLCLSRTVSRGWRQGLASGLGIATADAGYALIASMGLTIVAGAFESRRRWLELAAGAFLLLLAAWTMRAGPVARREDPAAVAPLGLAFASMFLLTAGNPLTILSFAALLTGAGVEPGTGPAVAAVVGVFLGSSAWWLVLVLVAARLHLLARPSLARGLNIIAAAVIAVFGLNAIWTSLRPR